MGEESREAGPRWLKIGLSEGPSASGTVRREMEPTLLAADRLAPPGWLG